MKSTENVNLRDGGNDAIPIAFQLGYEASLDGLRGIAILVVMAFNGHLFWMKGGFIGVDIFFVLSGFLITALLVQDYLQTSGMGLKHFYFRRALRLFPALFVLMLFCIAYALIFQSGDRSASSLKGVIYTLFYVANWAQIPPWPSGIGPLSHAWSLSVEEQFYFVWPLLLLVLLKLRSKGLVFLILIALIALSILTSVWLWDLKTPYLRMYFGSDTRAHELLIGCVAALLLSWGVFQQSTRLRRIFHVAAAISLVGILFSFFLLRHNAAFVYNGGFTLISIGTALLILDFLLFPSKVSRFFEFAPLVWIGKISYGLYLWHFPIFEASRKLFEGRMNPVFYEITGVVVTLLVATASYYLIEKPFLKLRLRYNTTDRAAALLATQSRTAEST